MSSIVAVAGGTGNLGSTITEAIVADGKVKVLILARKLDEQKEREIGASILPVDYTSVEELTRVLEENNIDTVISALNTMGDNAPELNLIKASEKAAMTRRYIPSIWGAKYPEEIAAISPIGRAKLAVASAVAATSLEHTVWYAGYFADYYVAPGVPSHMMILSVAVDVPNNTAAIPGSGDVPVVFTHTVDIAKFVAASLTLSKWEPETYLIGDKLTFNELVKVAEEVKGVKFKTSYDSLEFLKSGKVTELPSHPVMYPYIPKEKLQGLLSVFGIMFESGVFNFNPSRTSKDDFPDLTLRSLKDLLTEAYKTK
ncbi:NAD(P)-binding protein [Cadophora sp. DSE1049]|nr:NAD(P)-binding protein [Cadophora sp. DSE1049]